MNLIQRVSFFVTDKPLVKACLIGENKQLLTDSKIESTVFDGAVLNGRAEIAKKWCRF